MPTTEKPLRPALILEAAFGTSMTTAASSWTDVSADLRGFSINRGRTREDEPYRAGEMRLVMDNRSRQWDPEYSSGPHFGNLVPMLQVRLRATYNSTTYTLFYGYVESYGQTYPGQDADSYSDILVVDGFSVLQNALLPDSVWDYQTGLFVDDTGTYPGSAWYPLAEKYGTVMGDKGPNNKNGTYGAPIVSNQPGLVPYAGTGQALKFDGIDDYGSITIDTMPTHPYTIAFWMKVPEDLAGSDYLTILTAHDNSSASSSKSFVFYLDLVQGNYLVVYNERLGNVDFLNPRYSDSPLSPGRTYFVCFTYASADPKLYIDGVLQTNQGSGFTSTTYFTPSLVKIGGQTTNTGWVAWPNIIDDVAILGAALSSGNVLTWYQAGATPWNEDTSGARFTHVLDSVSWPASLRDIDAGESVLGPATLTGSAHQYLQLVEKTEQGRYFMSTDGKVRLIGRGNFITESATATSQATFGDGGGSEMKYFDIGVEPSNAQQILNEGVVSRQGGIDQRYRDSTSAASYGVRTRSESGLLMRSDGEAYDLAYTIVGQYKAPGFRVTDLVIKPQRDATNLFPKVLGYELATRITINRRPQGIGSAISKEVHIEGIQHSLDASTGVWTTTWSTAPIDPNAGNWCIVDTGTADTNLVSY